MTLKWHVITGAIGALVAAPIIGKWSAAFFVASVAIDADHYFDYVYHNGFRDFSVKRMFKYHDVIARYWRSNDFISIEAFHNVEFMAALFSVALIGKSPMLMAVFAGCLFHILLDMAYLGYHEIFFTRAHSVVEFFVRVRSMKAKGMNPNAVYDAAIDEVNGRA